MDRRDRRLQGKTPGSTRQRLIHEPEPLIDLRAIPTRAVLLVQKDDLTVAITTSGAARVMEQHQGDETRRLGRWFGPSQLADETAEADRFGAQVGAKNRRPPCGRVPFREHEVHHGEHGIEAFVELVGFGNTIWNAGVPNLSLGAYEALGHRGCRDEKGSSDFLGLETAERAQGQRDLRIECERRVAAREDEAKTIVRDLVGEVLWLVDRAKERRIGEGLDLLVEARAAPDSIERLVPGGLNNPRPGNSGTPVAGHWSTAAVNASCATSSARSKSPTRPMSVATIRPQSER